MKVFDSSAVLAVLFDEPGAELAVRWLEEDDAVISSVNQAEVVAKLLDKGLSEADVASIGQQLPLQVLAFTAQLAREQPLAQVVTANRPWAGLAGFNIAVIR